MAESSVNNLNGIPFWGHGTLANMQAGITPTNFSQVTESDDQENEEVTVESGDAEDEAAEDSESLG